MFGFIFKIKVAIRVLLDKIKKIVYKFIPSHIKALYYLSNSNIHSINKKQLKEYYTSNLNDYYIIHLWNSKQKITKYYFIKVKNMCEIFNVENYIKENRLFDIFHIEINNRNASKEIYKYKDSLNHKDTDKNSILLLNTVCDDISNSKEINKDIIINTNTDIIRLYDYNLDEIII